MRVVMLTIRWGGGGLGPLVDKGKLLEAMRCIRCPAMCGRRLRDALARRLACVALGQTMDLLGDTVAQYSIYQKQFMASISGSGLDIDEIMAQCRNFLLWQIFLFV